MTGKDVKQQQQALIGELLSEAGALEYTTEDELRELDAALAPCVVLTREEQAQLKAAYLAMGGAPFTKHANAASAWVYKLLTPDEAGDE